MKKIHLNNNRIDDIDILYEDNHLIVCIKPEGLLSQEDETKDLDILTILKEYIKNEYHKQGNVFLGLVHRLDRRVSGVMVFAKTSKAASRLSEQIRAHTFQKKYYAICCGILNDSNIIVSNLKKRFKDEFVEKNEKEAVLEYNALETFKLDEKDYTKVLVNLKTGRHNQIRKQFALIDHPLINDFKYDYRGKNYNDHIGLFCVEIGFNHPITKEFISFDYQRIKDFTINDWKEYFGEKI